MSRMGCTCARAHVHTHFLYLRNGWADWAQIWCVVEDQSAKEFPRVGWGARAHVHTHFLYLRNGWADWAQIWCVVEDQSAKEFPRVGWGAVRTCTPISCISGTPWSIVFKFGMCLGTGQLIGFHKSSEVPSHRSARAMRPRSSIANKASYWW